MWTYGRLQYFDRRCCVIQMAVLASSHVLPGGWSLLTAGDVPVADLHGGNMFDALLPNIFSAASQPSRGWCDCEESGTGRSVASIFTVNEHCNVTWTSKPDSCLGPGFPRDTGRVRWVADGSSTLSFAKRLRPLWRWCVEGKSIKRGQ